MSNLESLKSRNENSQKELSLIRSVPKSGCGCCLSWQLIAAITWGTSFEGATMGVRFEETGDWSPGPGVCMKEPLFPHISHGFRGISLPVVTFHNPPWQIIKYSNKGTTTIREYSGLIFDILRYLSLKLNFTYTVRLLTDFDTSPTAQNNVSSLNKNFVGAAISVAQKVPSELRELVRSKKVFLGAVALTSGENIHGINFTASIAVQTYALLSEKPKLLSRALLFTAPFTGGTWIWLSSMIIVIGPILYLTIKYSPRPVDPQDKINLYNLWQCSWYVYGALLQQGGMHLPKADSARLVMGTWWIVVMILVATYSGNLIAFLTFPRTNTPIDSIDDLLARSVEYDWSFPNGSALEGYLTAAAIEDDGYKKLLSSAGRLDPTKPKDILNDVKFNNHVLIDWKISLAFLMSIDLNDTGSCNFHLSTDDFMPENLAMLISEDSPYLTLINSAIKRMHESGLINKWTYEKMATKDKCWERMNSAQEATNHKVNMGDMQGIFFVLAIGFTLAVITISSEYFWHRRKVAATKNLIRPFVS